MRLSIKWITLVAAFIMLIAAASIVNRSLAPSNFPNGSSISINAGSTVTDAAKLLADSNIIKSPLLFRLYTTLIDRATGVKAGEYLFAKSESALRIAERLTHGDSGYPLLKVTIPEGSDTRQIAEIIGKNVPKFDKAGFVTMAKGSEGYLFPETYFWPANVGPTQVFNEMKKLFKEKVGDKVDPDVVKMASILEEEATSSEDRRIVAGILWRRMDAGMALQVDAPFRYILGKASSQLTLDDLKTDSSYNLYTHTGLPPTPISNPGLEAIEDARTPTKTDYWYFLSGKDGRMHYAKDLEGHVANKYKYL